MPTHPEVLWAQRSSETDDAKNIVYLTVNLPDIDPSSLKYDLNPTSLSFAATAGSAEHRKDYEFSIEFFDEVIPEESTKRITTRSLYVVLRKKTNQAEFWPRLTKDRKKVAFLKTDFSKVRLSPSLRAWIDEDDQDGATAKFDDDEGMDMGGMGGMGGIGGMGGMGGGGNMDFDSMMKSMGGSGGDSAGDVNLDSSPGGDDSDDDNDAPPPLEELEPSK